MANFQPPQNITITLDKQKIVDYLSQYSPDPEKFKREMFDVDAFLKAVAVGGKKDVEMVEDQEEKEKEEDLQEKVYF